MAIVPFRRSGSMSRLAGIAIVVGLGVAVAAAQDVSPLAERLALAEADVHEGEADLLAQARAAMTEAELRRARLDEAGARRAEAIAEAALELVRVRRQRDEAARRLEDARARRRDLDERVRTATEAARSAAVERDRLAGTAAER